MHLVRKARYMSGFRLLVTFDNGEERLVNLRPHLDGEVFEPLKDPEYFKRFRVNADIDTVVWENGADFSHDFLYDIGQPVTDAFLAADS
jgi:hypothetical protein